MAGNSYAGNATNVSLDSNAESGIQINANVTRDENNTSKLGDSTASVSLPFIDGNEVSNLLDCNVNRELKPACLNFMHHRGITCQQECGVTGVGAVQQQHVSEYKIVEVAPPSPRQRHLPKLFIPDCSIQSVAAVGPPLVGDDEPAAVAGTSGAAQQEPHAASAPMQLVESCEDSSFSCDECGQLGGSEQSRVPSRNVSLDCVITGAGDSSEENTSCAGFTNNALIGKRKQHSGVRRKFRTLTLRNCRKGDSCGSDCAVTKASHSASLENVSLADIETFEQSHSSKKGKRPWSRLAYRFRTKLKSDSSADVVVTGAAPDGDGCVCTGYKRTEGLLADTKDLSIPPVASGEVLIDLSKLNLSEFPTQRDLELESMPVVVAGAGCSEPEESPHQVAAPMGAGARCCILNCSPQAVVPPQSPPSQQCTGSSTSQPYPSVSMVQCANGCQQQQQQATRSTMLAPAATAVAPSYSVHTQIDYIHCLVPDLEHIATCNFYWGVMDRYEAERLLDNKPEGTFLLRDSAQEDFLFSVSFRRYGRSLHARIEQWNYRFSFDSHDPGVFASTTVCGLIEHYKDPMCCLFFEPMLTIPLTRNFVFSLQHLCRSVVVSRSTYDGVSALPIPKSLKHYLREYHYKQKVRVRRFELDDSGIGSVESHGDGACQLYAQRDVVYRPSAVALTLQPVTANDSSNQTETHRLPNNTTSTGNSSSSDTE